MTICVAVRVAEGLVLSADSTVALEGTFDTPQGQQRQIMQTFDYASKVTRIKDYPIGIMSWGLGAIQNRSIQSLIMEFEYDYPSSGEQKPYSVKSVADSLLTFIRGKYDTAFPPESERPAMGMFIGGYSSGQFFSHQYSVEIPAQNDWQDAFPDSPNGQPHFGAGWYGQIEALTRLISGFDIRSIQALINRGVDEKVVTSWIENDIPQLPLVFDGMPIQDAIDFANYAINLTIGRFRFGVGTPLCGGDIDIALVRPGGLQWAQRKQWSFKE